MEKGIVSYLIGALLLVVPVWRIHGKAGLNPALSLFLFVPYIGFLIVTLVLAFARWPATERTVERTVS